MEPLFNQSSDAHVGLTPLSLPQDNTLLPPNLLGINPSVMSSPAIPLVSDVFLLGDGNNDGALTNQDVDLILQDRNKPLVGSVDPRDFDGDGKITIFDVRKLGLFIKGNTDNTSPSLLGSLSNDTAPNGGTNTDKITADPSIQGTVTDASKVTRFRAGFDNTPINEFINIIGILEEDGSFALDSSALSQINGGSLIDGSHTLHLQAQDKWGNQSSVFDVSFTIDTQSPTVSVAPSGTFDTTFSFFDITYTESVSELALETNKYSLQDDNGQAINITSITQLNSTTVRVNLADTLVNGNYQLAINSSISDLAGNSLTGTTTFNFTIAELLQPARLIEISPANGEEMVNLTRETIIRFDERIDPETVNADSFYLIANGERIAGTIKVSSTEEFATFFYDNPLPSSTEVRVVVDGSKIIGRDGVAIDGDGDGLAGGIATADFTTLPITQIPGTDVWGYVYDSYNKNPDGSNIPIKGVTIRLDALPNVSAVTDDKGYFILKDVPAPEFFVYIDGSTATGAPAASQYASLGKAFHSVPGQSTQLFMDGQPFDVYLPPMAASDVKQLSATEDTKVGFGETAQAFLQKQFPDIDPELWKQVQVTFNPGSAQDDAGNQATQAMIIPVDPQRLPAPLPPGVDPKLVISIQAGGANGFNREAEGGATNFDVPAPIQFPNLEGLKPGEKSLFWSFDHDAGKWIVIGTGTVSEDGKTIVSDPGVGVLAPGWHFTISGTRSRFRLGGVDGGFGTGNDFNSQDDPTASKLGTVQRFRVNKYKDLTDKELTDLLVDGIKPGGSLATDVVVPLFLDWNTPTVLPNKVTRESSTSTDPSKNKNTLRHDIGSTLSDLVKSSEVFKGGGNLKPGVFDTVKKAIEKKIQQQADTGTIEVFLGKLALNNKDFPTIGYSYWPFDGFNDFLADPPELRYIIGGIQGRELQIQNFDAKVTKIDEQNGINGEGEFSATLRFVFLDDFGVDENDVYRLDLPSNGDEALIAQWVLQHQRQAKPFVNEIIVEETIQGKFTIPDQYETFQINIEGQAPKLKLQLTPQFDELEEVTPTTSTAIGFGSDPGVYYRYVLSNGTEIAGKLNPEGFIPDIVLPPQQNYTATFYQPSTNRSTVILERTSPSGALTLLSDSPMSGIGGSDQGSILNLTDFGGLDADGDGIPDIGEFAIGTDPNSIDSDGDGIKDSTELEQGLDPLGGQAFPTGIISSLPVRGEAKAVVVEGSTLQTGGQTAYVATGSYGLAIVDASQFNNPIILGQLDLLGDATDVAVDSNLQIAAVASNSGGLQLVDVSDPMLPKLLRTVNITPNQVEVINGLAYTTAGNSLRVVDLLTGDILQSLNLPGSGAVTGLAREGTKLYAFTSGSDTFSIIDIANQGAASILGQLNVSVASSDVGVFAANGVAYLAGSGLRTINVSNPQTPTLISDADFFSTARNVKLNGSGLAIVAAEDQGVALYDITNPENTNNVLLTINTPGFARDIAIASGIAFVADNTGGLQVINYLPFDNKGIAPTITISSPVTDLDPNAEGVQIFEGTTIPIQANILDDVQVRNVELLVNGQVVSNDVSFPFDFAAIAPNITPDSDTITVQARATDTGGNITLSDPLTFKLAPDTFAPTIVKVEPGDSAITTEGHQTVRVQFSEPLATETVNQNTFKLVDSSGNALVPIDIQLRSDDQIVQLTFNPLPLGSYKLVIDAPEVTDRAGNILGSQDIVSSFTVEEITSLTTTDLNTLTAELLAQFLVGEGVSISNVKFTGAKAAGGIFNGGISAGIGIRKGVILSSGSIANASEPNDSDGKTTSFGTAGDTDLNTLINGTTNDAAVLEFDFVPQQSQISFQYVFGSEEYNEYVGSFNDVFGFFIDGKNIALIPETTTPVSINNLNINSNSQFFKNNDPSNLGTPTPFKVEFDGFTTVLTAETNLEAGVPHHIKLAIADAGDSAFDSAVFLSAASFTSDKNI